MTSGAYWMAYRMKPVIPYHIWAILCGHFWPKASSVMYKNIFV